MSELKELEDLSKQAKYQEVIAAVDAENIDLRTGSIEDAKKVLQKAWARHQRGEYDLSMSLMNDICLMYPPTTDVGESARRGLAHGFLQKDGNIDTADSILKELPAGFDRDNVRMNTFIMAVRKKIEIPVKDVMAIIMNALQSVPYATINGHIVNNGALVFHEAREQEAVKSYLPILPGLIDAAIGIYEATGTAKNHIAGAEYRAAQICRANGLLELAVLSAEQSVKLWQALVASQDGQRYRKNLENAEKLSVDIRAEATKKLMDESIVSSNS